MFDEILLHPLIGFQNIYGQHNQVFVLKFFGDVVNHFCLGFAELAPGRPEFEENDFAFDRLVIELFASRGFGAEAGSGLADLVGGEGSGSGKQGATSRQSRMR